MENIINCNNCLAEILYYNTDVKVDLIDEGDNEVYVEYICCPHCGEKVLTHIVSESKGDCFEI